MVSSVHVVGRALFEPLLEVVSLDRRAAPLLADARSAPHERLVLRLDATHQLLDSGALGLAIVFVDALVRALQDPYEAVLLVPAVLADHRAVRLLLVPEVAGHVVFELFRRARRGHRIRLRREGD